MPKTSRFDEHLIVVVDDPATSTGQDRGRVLGQQFHLHGQTIGKKQVVLTHKLDELATRHFEAPRPVRMQVGYPGGSFKETDPRIAKRFDDFYAAVGRILISDHDFNALMRLLQHRVQTRFEVTFAVQDGYNNGDQGRLTQEISDRIR
jgi:hypothetical protein